MQQINPLFSAIKTDRYALMSQMAEAGQYVVIFEQAVNSLLAKTKDTNARMFDRSFYATCNFYV